MLLALTPGSRAGRADWQPVATFSDLARQHTDLERPDVVHLLRLLADWGMLADFCFADVLLYAPARDGRWLVMTSGRCWKRSRRVSPR